MTSSSPLTPFFLPFLKIRADYLSRLVSRFLPPRQKVLDIGCGNMLVSQLLHNSLNVYIQGIDVLDMNLTSLPHQIFDGQNIPFPKKSFHASLLIGVLHHILDQDKILTETCRVTQSRIIIFEDIYSHPLERLWIKFRDLVGNLPEEPRMNFALNFHSDSEWSAIFKKHKLWLIHKHIFLNPARLTRHALYILQVGHTWHFGQK